MDKLQAIFTKTFDRIFIGMDKEKTCQLHLEHDLFDGKEYSIDEFHQMAMAYYDCPSEFYSLFGYDTIPNLRLGLHSNQQKVYWQPQYMMIYDSPVQTAWPENNIAPFKWYTGKNQLSNVMLLFCHGWSREDQWLEEYICSRLQKKHKVDAGLMTLPFHQARTPVGTKSGEYFLNSNIFWSIANFRQFVAEIRLMIRQMRSYYDYIGLIGMSSGGFQAMLASDCEKIDFLFPYFTGCHLADITWESAVTTAIKRDLVERHISKQDLDKAWSITDEAVFASHCKATHIKHYISLYDTIVPPKYQYELWKKLGMHDKLELPCGHISGVFFLRTIADDIAETIKHYIKVRSNPKPIIPGELL